MSAIWSLIYLLIWTRPEVSFTVSKKSRWAENPILKDWKIVINILKYLNYTKYYKITYKGQGEIVAYADFDCAGDPTDRKLTSDIYLSLFHCLHYILIKYFIITYRIIEIVPLMSSFIKFQLNFDSKGIISCNLSWFKVGEKVTSKSF
jgi:hypothetical protein